jgi:hypothetical protein
MTSSVWVFFYGGLINPTMLDKVGMKPKRQEPATLSGFDIRISPYVNLVRSAGHTVSDSTGHLRPALCYIVPDMPPGQAEADHVETLAAAAESLGFPSWYLSRIRSFLPAA